MQTDTQQSLLNQLRYVSGEIEAAAFVAGDGQILAFSPNSSPLEGIAPPLAISLTEIADRAVQELGRGMLESIVLRGSMGLVIGQELGDGRLLLVVASQKAPLGLLLNDVSTFAQNLSKSEFERGAMYQ